LRGGERGDEKPKRFGVWCTNLNTWMRVMWLLCIMCEVTLNPHIKPGYPHSTMKHSNAPMKDSMEFLMKKHNAHKLKGNYALEIMFVLMSKL